jgi:hypothetical protein
MYCPAETPEMGLLNHAVNASAGEHGTAFHVDRAHREAEQHDGQDEPRRGRANRLLGDAPGIKRGRSKIAENHGCRAPKRDEREHHGGCHNEPDAV